MKRTNRSNLPRACILLAMLKPQVSIMTQALPYCIVSSREFDDQEWRESKRSPPVDRLRLRMTSERKRAHKACVSDRNAELNQRKGRSRSKLH